MDTIWREHIESTPGVIRGKPRIKGSRIPVSLILGFLAEGSESETILRDYPDLKPEHIAACLDYARELALVETAA